jgi:hypothetical protein
MWIVRRRLFRTFARSVVSVIARTAGLVRRIGSLAKARQKLDDAFEVKKAKIFTAAKKAIVSTTTSYGFSVAHRLKNLVGLNGPGVTRARRG